MKKILVLLLCLLLAFTFFAGCSADEPVVPPAPSPSANEPATEPTEEPEPELEVETEPEPEVSPEPASDPVPEARIFTGSGDDVILLEAFPGPYVFVVTGNDADRHFAVHAHGSRRSLLVNTTSPYSGITLTDNQDTEMLEVTAVGDWTIEQRSLSDMRTISEGETIIGSGDEVIKILSHGQTAEIEGNEAGRHFAVRSHGARRNLLVNTTSQYTGRVVLRGSYTILEVTAVGDWSITFE